MKISAQTLSPRPKVAGFLQSRASAEREPVGPPLGAMNRVFVYAAATEDRSANRREPARAWLSCTDWQIH